MKCFEYCKCSRVQYSEYSSNKLTAPLESAIESHTCSSYALRICGNASTSVTLQ